jgi:hypothetical protein
MKRFLLSLGLLGFAVCLTPARAEVVINEIMHHPASGSTNEQFIEIFNPGPADISLAGWQLDGAVHLSFSPQTLPAGGYLVAVANRSGFQAAYPTVSNFVGDWTGFLDSGATVRLKDGQGNTVDSVTYSNDGNWAVRKIGEADADNARGWVWFAAHDGAGSSLELVNPKFSHKLGQNWESSGAVGGTPGGPNSTASTNSAPFVGDVAHFPVIPGPTNAVLITVRVADENPATTAVKLFWRVDASPAPAFQTATMLDDGLHGDGTAGDGIFGFRLPAQARGAIVEYYVTATDAEGQVRTYPRTEPSLGRTANLVYQVDDATRATAQSLYRVIMTASEKAALDQVEATQALSDAASNGTLVTQDGTGTELRYLITYRNRGHGTRYHVPHNLKIEVPSETPWKGRTSLNLNAAYPYNQAIGSAIMRRAGLIMAESRLVQVQVNGSNLAGAGQYGSYAANWGFNADLIKTQQPQDVGGNLYRGIRDFNTSITPNLVWHSTDYRNYTNAYFKENNLIVDDWSDLIDLIAALNVTNGFAEGSYVANLLPRVNVEQWMRFFAVHTLMDDQETTLGSGYGDDYALYHGLADTRFQLLPYDMDTVLGQGDTAGVVTDDLFRMTGLGTSHYLPAIDRLMKTPEFARIYYRQLKDLGETLFTPTQLGALVDQVYAGNGVPSSVAEAMKSFGAQRTAWVLSQIPTALTVGSGLAVNNSYPHATTGTATLFGQANALETASVRVNGAPADYVAWQGRWTNAAVSLHPGINRVLVQAFDARNLPLEQTTYDVWYDDGSVQPAGGPIAADTTWTAANGPYLVGSSLTVNSGVTLTIEPGTTVYLGAGVNFTVANGGRLLAEGRTNAPIRFARQPGATATWGGLVIDGAVGSPETRISHTHFEGNGTTCIEVAGGTVFLDYLTFGSTDHQYLALDGASFVVSHCVFPTTSAPFELVHGTGGVKAGGHGIVRECFFGSTTGYNDIMDFTGGNRPDQPIIEYYHNVLVGGSDDGLDLDGTDAWIEGNIFLHIHKNGAPDSSSAVSGGNTGADTSEITMIGNLFFDCDQAATAKQGNFFTLINNTMVHTTKAGGLDTEAAIVNPQDRDPGPPTTYGRGFYLEGNIVVDTEQLVRNYDAAQTTVTWNRNLLPVAWTGPGSGNVIADPQLVHIPTVAETQFKTWEEAQVLWQWFALQPGSPARGAGPNGRDLGGVIPRGVSLSGAPTGTTNGTAATITVGLLRTGSGIPTAGFPQGSGFTHYQWRRNGDPGVWSAETPMDTPITLTGLTNGFYQVQVIGKNDAGTYQNDPLLGEEALVTSTWGWNVDTNYVPPAPVTLLRLNEVLARNDSFAHGPANYPDMVELYNGSGVALDLTGFGLAITPKQPMQFVFPAGTTLAAGGYLVLYGGNADGTAGLHLGFKLGSSGDALYLYDAQTNQLDEVTFGPQLPDLSIGRGPDGQWRLSQPTFGAANVTVATGDPEALRINEWLAAHGTQPVGDFIELYNPGALPVDMTGLSLANAPAHPGQNPLTPLTFIPANGFAVFQADGSGPGNDRLNFTLAPEAGAIFLAAADLHVIDSVIYGPQTNDVSQGRSPNGGTQIVAFVSPTPGGGNPAGGNGGGDTNITTVTLPLVAMTNVWKYWEQGDLGTTWSGPGFNDGTWPSGPALLYVETSALPAPKNTPLTLGKTTYYFRTHFSFPSNTAGARLALQTVVDDGAIFWLNGQELHRLGMAAGAATYATDASRNVDNALLEGPFDLPATALQQGDNVLAVEVHQSGANSSDIVFGLALDGKISITNSVVPTNSLPVALNEILAHNYGLAEADGSYPDWVELYNPNAAPVSLDGLALTDDLVAGRKFTFGSGTVLAAHAFFRLRCEAALPASPTNSGFTFDQHGASFYLLDTVARGGGVVDSVTFGLQVADRTLSRVPDGTGAWTLGQPTPGTANAGVALTTAESVKVNEWMANPSVGDDWFELFNAASVAADLSGAHLSDDLAARTKFTLPPLSFIGSGTNAFVLFHADNNPEKGANHVNFKLSAKGDDIGLYAPDGTEIDAVTFGPQAADVSAGRLPDGGVTLVTFPTLPTPGLPNLADTDLDGMADDWELLHGLDPKNPADAALDADADGRSNAEEFVAGTDPKDAASALELRFTELSDALSIVRFTALPGHAYTLEGADELSPASWKTLAQVSPRPGLRVIDLSEALSARPLRFYRLLVGPETP